MLSYLWYELQSRRSAIIGWGIGVSFFVVLYSIFYPALPEEMRSLDLMDIVVYQAFGQMDLRSFGAYFGSAVLNFMALLLIIFAVVNGTGTLVGEEERGTLELVVAFPLKRWQIVLAKALAMMLSVFFILLMVVVSAVLVFFVVDAQVETGISSVDLVLPILNAWPIVVVFMMISLFFSALMPQRRYASAAATVVVAASFLGNNFLPMVEGLGALAAIFPFHYYPVGPRLLIDGVPLSDALVLIAASAVFLLLAMVSFSARNVTTGRWAWQ